MSAEAADEALFGDTLACEEIRPAAFLPGELDAATELSYAGRGESLLRALAVVEDGGRNEDPEQLPADYSLHRLEAKLDLLTALVVSLGPSHDSDPSQLLRWSARGACLLLDRPLPVGSGGRFRVQPADWVPSPLVLPAHVLACETEPGGRTRTWLRFTALSPVLEAALERHLFRIHRRGIAESRRPR